jgi:hypothetical protein
MSVNPAPKPHTANTFKLYVFPAVVSVLATLIWRDVTEMRSDIKMLLAQSNVDKTEIQQLKKEVDMLNRQVYKTAPLTTRFNNRDFMYDHDTLYKHEEIFDIKKHIISENIL